ncbi:MAG: hypothetical protein ACFFBZ_16035 [Promethearchaeota archaeon]
MAPGHPQGTCRHPGAFCRPVPPGGPLHASQGVRSRFTTYSPI